MRNGLGLTLTLLGVTGCISDQAIDTIPSPVPPEPRLGLPCNDQNASDCATSEVCVLGYCRLACARDKACPPGLLCLGSGPRFGCQLAQEASCSFEQPCPEPLVCGLDKTCRMGCAESKDCPREEQKCYAGTCVGDTDQTDAAVAYRMCGELEGTTRCGQDWAACGAGLCEVQGCNMHAPGWAVIEQCEKDTAFCAHGRCVGIHPEGPGPLVQVTSPQGETYGIDATEVTRAQYAKFVLEKQVAGSGQLAQCSWNTTFVPAEGDWRIGNWPPVDRPDDPVNYVDWCDAYAYCEWAGKRLCGRIGGGAIASEDLANAQRSQWYNACSSGGQYDYPYGDMFAAKACNTLDMGVGTTTATGSLTGCQSSVEGYTGVYDLCGNVYEWEDSCEELPFSRCNLRGGGFNDLFMDSNCSDILKGFIRGSAIDYGFRCCSL